MDKLRSEGVNVHKAADRVKEEIFVLRENLEGNVNELSSLQTEKTQLLKK